jgi:hypothetical protein
VVSDGDERQEVGQGESEEARVRRRPPRVVRLPRFVVDEEVGAGDVIKRATSAVGIKPCGGCLGRAAALNHRLVLRPRR